MAASGGPLGLRAGLVQESRNPFGQTPYFFHRINWRWSARRLDIATMRTEAAGTIRRWWVQLANEQRPAGAFSWPRDTFDTTGSCQPARAGWSAPRRYMISTRFSEAGDQLSNPDARAVVPFQRWDGQPPAIVAGQQQGRPTVRNRLTSFGSRVPPVNQVYPSEQVPS